MIQDLMYKLTDTSSWSMPGVIVVGILVLFLISANKGGSSSNSKPSTPSAPPAPTPQPPTAEPK